MKKILFYTDSKEFGGAENYLSVVLGRLPQNRFTPVFSGPIGPLRFAVLLQREKPDIVHFNLPVSFSCVIPLLTCRCFKKLKVTATIHSVDTPSSRIPFLGQIKKMIALRTLRRVQSFICVSQKSKEAFCKNYGIDPEKIVVVYNGIDVPENAGTTAQTFAAGTVSRLVKKKGLEVLIESFSKLSEDKKLLIVGDGPLRDKFIKLAKDLGLKDRVIFAGHQKEILPFLLAMDVFVMPSLSESMPFALMEAMAAGRACVSTDVGGVKELIIDGQNGILVPPGDPDKLCDAISLLSGNRDKLSSLGKAAKKTIEENFSIGSMMRGTEQFFDDVVLGRARA